MYQALRQILAPWETLIFPKLLISVHEESLSVAFSVLSLPPEYNPLSL